MGEFTEPTDSRGVPYRIGDRVRIVALHIGLGDVRQSIRNLFNRAACRPLRIDDIDGHPGGDTWLSFHVRRDGSQAAPEEFTAHTLNVLPEEVERIG